MGWKILATMALLASAWAEETCLSTDENPYVMFGDKTAYLFAVNQQINTKVTDVPGCNPIAIWLLNRHGSHNPEPEQIAGLLQLKDYKNNVLSNYKNGNFRNTQHRICPSDLKLLEQWKCDDQCNASFAGHLTAEGYMTTQDRAKEWKQKYPGLLTDNRHDYMFKSADDERSAITFKAFTEGLFRAQAEIYDIPNESGENVDRILRPHKYCPAWSREVENNETLSQRQIFESKQEYKEMVSNISLRLGFSYSLHAAAVLQMYDMCRYNKAWAVRDVAPWCEAFTAEDLKRLEYAEDLDTYYKYGYGSPLNQKLGCTLVKEMLEFFNKTHVPYEQPQQPKVKIQFADAASILLLMTSLNGHRDAAPITGDNYRLPLVQARQWRTSKIAPFNANLAAVLYKCTPNGRFQVNDPYQVLFLENGQPLSLEGCRVGLCEWSTIMSKYGPLVDQCNQNHCNSAITTKLGLSLIFITIIKYVLL